MWNSRLKTDRIGEGCHNSKEWIRRCCMTTRLVRDLLEVEIVCAPKRTNLDGWGGTMSIYTDTEFFCLESYTHLVNVVPVWDGQRIGEIPILIHEIELVPHQQDDHNQLHLQLGHFDARTWMPAGSPTKERIGGVRERVWSQPSTGIVLIRIRVVFGVQVDVSQGIREEISPFYHLFANFHLTNVPPEGGAG